MSCTKHRLFIFSILLSIPILGNSQSYLGTHLSQYDPLKSVYFNPAAMTNSKMRWQVNILSADISVGNDFLRVATLKGIFKKFEPYNFFEVNMNGQDKNANIQSDIRGPGFMINFGKNSFAFSTRIKEVASVNNLDEDFAYSLFHHYNDLLNYIPAFDNEHASAAINAYSEYSIAYARKLIKKEKHELSAGVNFKILDKIFYGSFDARNVQFNKLEGLLDTSVNVHNSKFDLIVSDDYEDKHFVHDWTPDGWAVDVGMEYIFKSGLSDAYKLKIGVALNDFGTLQQNDGSTSFYFVGNNTNVSASSLEDENGDIKPMLQVLDSLGTRTPLSGKRKITLPSTLHIYADVKVVSNFYVYGGLQVNPYDFKKKIGLANLPTQITIVPRFESKRMGIFAPLSWDKYENFSSGVGFRFAQFSLGSANILSSIIKKNFTGVNIFLSLSVGGKRRTQEI